MLVVSIRQHSYICFQITIRGTAIQVRGTCSKHLASAQGKALHYWLQRSKVGRTFSLLWPSYMQDLQKVCKALHRSLLKLAERDKPLLCQSVKRCTDLAAIAGQKVMSKGGGQKVCTMTALHSKQPGWGVLSGQTRPLMQNCASCTGSLKSPPYPQYSTSFPFFLAVVTIPWSTQSQMNPPCNTQYTSSNLAATESRLQSRAEAPLWTSSKRLEQSAGSSELWHCFTSGNFPCQLKEWGLLSHRRQIALSIAEIL